MKIKLVEIQNFRKLKSVRIDFSDETTVFVGANNSGKTSAMIALGHFLVDPKRFTAKDFTISHWDQINEIGEGWVESADANAEPDLDISQWMKLCPSLDVWLDAGIDEVHYVRHLIPSLDWPGGLLGVRLQFVPKDLEALYKGYVVSADNARKLIADAQGVADGELDGLKLWPSSLADYIDGRRLQGHFERQAFLLDPTKLDIPEGGVAKPQALPDESEKLEVPPFEGLIRIDEVDAQRGFADAVYTQSNDSGGRSENKRLSDQLRKYYQDHIDPTDAPEPEDLEALQSIQTAQNQFDAKLRDGFSSALEELEDLGYPGITDPRVTIASRIRPEESLNHPSAVQYDVSRSGDANAEDGIRLPEQYIGLGYQNLISIVFRLMSFRDAWMRVKKASKTSADGALSDYSPPPIHLVMVEEPEAHLHAQVQQVFIRKAYGVLRKHKDLGKGSPLSTQLIVSTHSSHIAHETDFSSLRYFRRLPAGFGAEVPISTVVNLSEIFGKGDTTAKFVSRYLKTTHCDLFFADATILVEGPVERMLVPLFIQNTFPELHARYVTLLEIGGSHAHRLQPLIEKLHLPTLIITDLDPARDESGQPLASPKRGAGLISRNHTLHKWVPKIKDLDKLLDLQASEKVIDHDLLFSVCVAYQSPVMIKVGDDEPKEAIAATFEDSLAFENLDLFDSLEGLGLIHKFREAIKEADNVAKLGEKLREAIKKGQKAEFALDLLYHDEAEKLRPPTYIGEGLQWLQGHLNRTKVDILPEIKAPAPKAEKVEAGNGGN
ncbi:MAG: ATP-dependent endonuclease [Rhodospirillaceae bacterium]|nr:MAG: ATP-dependent endonuclease [Rhodospirillaceae bacterium]